jgi:hypothetical protein
LQIKQKRSVYIIFAKTSGRIKGVAIIGLFLAVDGEDSGLSKFFLWPYKKAKTRRHTPPGLYT